MRVSREFSLKVQFVLDQLLPPILRDSKWFMYIPMKVLFREVVEDFLHFKNTVFSMSDSQFSDLYARTKKYQEIQGESDLNEPCIDEIIKNLVPGASVLEVGCGRGYLAEKIAQAGYSITAVDFMLSEKIKTRKSAVCYAEGDIQQLNFADDSFDTVVSTHTLEHVRDLHRAINQLRRIAKHRLIIVIPCQRPYRYTFSLHAHFFPYQWSIIGAFGYRERVTIKKLGDWFYVEDLPRSDEQLNN